MSADPDKLPLDYIRTEAGYEHAIDDGVQDNNFTRAHAIGVLAMIEKNTDSSEVDHSAEHKPDFDTIVHQSLIEFMQRNNCDSTYILIANMQFKAMQDMKVLQIQEQKDVIAARLEAFKNAGNQEQFAKTDAIRKEHGLYLAAKARSIK